MGCVRWIDVEGELWKYAKSKTGQNLSAEFISRDATAFYLLKSRLEKYIRRMHPYEWDSDKEDPNVRPFLEAIKINGNFRKIFTFNYTDVQLTLKYHLPIILMKNCRRLFTYMDQLKMKI